MTNICVYCGSSGGTDPIYREAAVALGYLLAERKIKLVYGGGGIGLMGATADAALLHGGMVAGVIPEFLDAHELGHRGVSEMYVVATMHERKQKMIDLADGFIAMPGGFGTLEELFEVLAWSQLQLHSKPIGLLNINGYYDGIVACINRMVEEKFLRSAERDRMIVRSTASELIAAMEVWTPPADAKWDDPEFR